MSINIVHGVFMAKLSLYQPYKTKDYTYADKISSENFTISGVGVILHKYVGPTTGGDETTIDDVLLLENRNRKYDDVIYDIKCFYTPQDTDFDLSQFGIFLSSDTLRIDFHLNDMIDLIGRKIMSGDVIEFVNIRDVTLTGEKINKFYVVQDSLFSASGFGPTWNPHVWKVKAKEMTDSQEYKEIVKKAATGETSGGLSGGTGILPAGFIDSFDGSEICTIKDAISSYCKYININDNIIERAEQDVFYDPKFVEAQHLYVEIDPDGYPLLREWLSGTSVPPNNYPLKGVGVDFPDDMNDTEYFLRIDFTPDRLFQKQGNRYVKIYDDLRRYWTAYGQELDRFIDNTEITTFQDGTSDYTRQGLSGAGKSKIDLNKDNKKKITSDRKLSAKENKDRYEGK
jgi:hypothetical protein